jgi:hypothetical protein
MVENPPPVRGAAVNSLMIKGVRYGLPALLITAVLVAAIAAPGGIGRVDAAVFVGAGFFIFVLNFMLFYGVAGDRDREEEDAARRFLDENGRWPNEAIARSSSANGFTAPTPTGDKQAVARR